MTLQAYYMKCDDFFKRWLGIKDDFDGVYKNQCVDTAKRFMQEVCDIPHPPATGNGWAHGYWYNRTSIPEIYRNFGFISDKTILRKGDIVITSNPHVAIFSDGKLFGQNHGGNLEANAWVDFSVFDKKFLGALRYKYVTSGEEKKDLHTEAYRECAKAVINGEYGNGHDTRADNIYSRVRTWVNNYCTKGIFSGTKYIDDIVIDVCRGRHGNGHTNRRNSIYALVRENVNNILKR